MLVLAASPANAGEAAAGSYAQPSEAVVETLEARPRPFVEASPDGRHFALLFHRAMPSAEELARPVLGLGGLLIDPASNGPARGIRFDGIRIATPTGSTIAVSLPPDAGISTVRWSPDGARLAFLNHTRDSIELWTTGADDGTARLVTRQVNAAFAEPFVWLPDSSGLIARVIPAGRAPPPQRPEVPAGPEIRETAGRPTPVQTLSNLLESAHDDALFRYYFTSRIVRFTHGGEHQKTVGEPAIVDTMTVAPNGRYLLVERLHEPFSRAFSAPGFPREIAVISMEDGSERHVAELPGADRGEALSSGGARSVRSVTWRSDAPATLIWARAEARAGTVRDRIYCWSAPFEGKPVRLAELDGWFIRAHWTGRDLAVIEMKPPDSTSSIHVPIDPSRIGQRVAADEPLVGGFDRLLTAPGTQTLALAPSGLPIALDDAGGAGTDRVLVIDPKNGDDALLHRFPADGFRQQIAAILDSVAGTALAWREDSRHPPNLYYLDAGQESATRLTDFPDPAPAFAAVRTVSLTYRRSDGVSLTAKLYLPATLADAPPRPLPTVMWAYPVRRSAPLTPAEPPEISRFVRPSGVDPLLLTASGYAVLIADMPVIEVGDPVGLSFSEQLVANSSAAIGAGAASGWVDRDRVAIAGHSFGAGMAANLLASSDLFAAGIALSGAYNRTLTPFGFQTERKSLWEASEKYEEASPFQRADAIDAPLLLVHGAADTNSGTLPMQSERMFDALRGLGKPARLVMLPGEGHSYTARESVLHVMAEIEDWLARYLKPAGRSSEAMRPAER